MDPVAYALGKPNKPCFFRILGRRLVPFQSIRDTMDVHINSNSRIAEMQWVMTSVVSNGKHAYRFQAVCKAKNAIFGPTPGREQSSSTVFGTSESKSSRSFCAAFLRYPVLRRQNPTLSIAREMVDSSAPIIPSIEILPPRAARSLDMAASVISSFVCDESMSDTRVANRRFCTGLVRHLKLHDSHCICTLGSVSPRWA